MEILDKKKLLIILEIAEICLNEGNAKRAILELKKIDHSKLDKYHLSVYYILYTRANFSLANYDESFIDMAIELLTQSSNHKLFAEAKSFKARLIISKGGDLITAKELLNESYYSFLRAGKPRLAASALNKLANISFQSGDMLYAINQMKQCLNLLKEAKDYSSYRRISRNLALMYFACGSINCSLEIHIDFHSTVLSQSELSQFKYHLTYALSTAFKGDIVDAQRLISKTLEYSDSFKREKAIYYEYLGWIYILDNKFEKAVETLKTGIKLSMKIAPESDLISQTKRLLADAYIGLGKYKLAKKTADEAMIVARRIGEKSEIGAVHRIYALVASHDENYELAKEEFNKAIDIFKLIQSRYELSVTRYLLATGGACRNGEVSYLLFNARDYFVSEELTHWIKRVDEAIEKHAQPSMPKPIKRRENGTRFIAKDSKTKQIVKLAESVATTDLTILLSGPTGTGKDCLAKYIHEISGREGQFINVNCAAFADNMIEAELFGHKKGSFTGADNDKPGLMELAHDGTLYLNEISNASDAFQKKILEVIESRKIRPVGSGDWRKIEFQLIAATNEDLQQLICEKKFRHDLYYRLNQYSIDLPPLDDRKGDIPELIGYFLNKLGFDKSDNKSAYLLKHFCDKMGASAWPGNVRQLENELGRVYHLCSGDLEKMLDCLENDRTDPEKDELVAILVESGWNQREAGRKLGVSEATIRRRISKYNLNK